MVIRRLRDGFSRILQQSPNDLYRSVRYSQDGQKVASGGHQGGIMVSNVRTGKRLASYMGHVHHVCGLVFTPDGKGLVSASWDKIVIHWDVSWLESTYDNQEEDVSTQDSAGGLSELFRFVGHEVFQFKSVLPAPHSHTLFKDFVYAISISPDGSWIASGSSDNTVRIWNAHTAALQCILHGHEYVRSVDFSRSGDYLAVGNGNGKVTVWNFTKLLE